MIGQLRGHFVSKKGEKIILDVQGVGYEVIVPASVLLKTADFGKELVLQIYTHVREDSFLLYGFLTEAEKELFLLLLSVSGIGPRVGLTLLSELSPQILSEVILTKNEQRLVTIPGIGKKTAERLILELKDKIKKLSFGSVSVDKSETRGTFEDLSSALLNLGYKQAQIDRVIYQVKQEAGPQVPFSDLLKQSLRILRA